MPFNIQQSLHLRYANVDALRKCLNEVLGENGWNDMKFVNERYDLTVCRKLTPDEIDYIRKNSTFYHKVRAENDAIRERYKNTQRAPAPRKIKPRKTQPRKTQPGKTRSTPVPQTPPEDQDGAIHTEAEIVASSLPAYDPTDELTFPLNMDMDGLPEGLGRLQLNLSNDGSKDSRYVKGMYSVEIEAGETAKVFDVKAVMQSENRIHGAQEKGVYKARHPASSPLLAIKQLKEPASVNEFFAEYQALRRANSLHHPNIVETLSVFKCEVSGVQYFNFAFPLALGNLKRLFRGAYDHSHTLQKQCVSLWRQYPALASAVAYLHGSLRTAHRDIKPSNILIYQSSTSQDLILKVTDFGLSIDLTKALSWEHGSLAAQSAWSYDSPEVRHAPKRPTRGQAAGQFRIPSSEDLLSNDIWKLGCVFTELTAFLVRSGSRGVTGFRNYITTREGAISSDFFNDTRFDDGEKVKPEVLEWLDGVSMADTRAAELRPVLQKMLDKSSERPKAEEVCLALIEASFAQTEYNDGARLVRFTTGNNVKPLGRFNAVRFALENWLGQPVDWRPLPPIPPRCSLGETMVSWQWATKRLYLTLTEEEFDRYKVDCVPVFGSLPVLWNQGQPSALPFSNPSSTSGQQGAAHPMHKYSTRQATKGKGSSASSSQQQAAPPAQSLTAREMYWCIDKIFTEPLQTVIDILGEKEDLKDDEAFYREVNKAIHRAAGTSYKGWFARAASWKRCTKVEFVKFYRRRKDRVDPAHIELPPSSEIDYNHDISEPQDVKMRQLGRDMVEGLLSPHEVRGERGLILKLPRKLNPPPLKKDLGTSGWGLHATMGFSVQKIVKWFVVCLIATGAFAATWLSCISATDLQDAFIPATILLTVLTMGLAVVQLLESRPM